MLFTVYVTLSKELAKLLYLSDRTMRRMTNAVSWDSVQYLCLEIKSMFSTTGCMRNLSSLKIQLFFLNERWYELWLKIAITCFSNTHFTCKITSALYIWHIKAGKVVLLRPKLETVLAPVSYRSSRRHRQRKRPLLKVPNILIRATLTDIFDADLDGVLRNIQADFPNAGYRRMQCQLNLRGIKVSQSRVRESMQRTDPDGIHMPGNTLSVQHEIWCQFQWLLDQFMFSIGVP